RTTSVCGRVTSEIAARQADASETLKEKRAGLTALGKRFRPSLLRVGYTLFNTAGETVYRVFT
ncbi:MAG TPA: hypothetical protein VK208_07435, partial [Pyrinomonadaceae bacterium]|nr:hypothetical protein [Pyrinomonadaceae bacterium]